VPSSVFQRLLSVAEKIASAVRVACIRVSSVSGDGSSRRKVLSTLQYPSAGTVSAKKFMRALLFDWNLAKPARSLQFARRLFLRKRGQCTIPLLVYWENLMSLPQRVCKTLGVLGLAVALPSLVYGQSTNYYAPLGGEYLPAGSLPGDQINPSAALSTSGGYLVWQDNITDGSGYGISAVQLDATFSPIYGNFRVNVQGTNDQENPQVTRLNGGGAAFVWQGGLRSYQHIYARFLSKSNTWVTSDVMVNAATNYYQANPAIATLTNGNVIVTWASYGQDNSDGLQGVYASVLSPGGTNLSGEIPINQFTPHNQRTPAVAALSTGGFVVVWVSEGERSFISAPDPNGTVESTYNSVDIYARLYNANGTPSSNEFLVNTSTNTCADPTVAAASDGSFMIAWAQKDKTNPNNSWDVYARTFSSAGVGGVVQTVNTQLYGDQYDPKISSVGTDYLIVWTSLGQDGSWEGIFGQFIHENGTTMGGEFQVNTTVLNAQKFQTVASDGVGRFLVTWSSFVGGIDSMDLTAQRYATTLQPLSAPASPVVSAVDSYTLSVTWAPIEGFSVAYWNLYVDSSATPVQLTNIYWVDDDYEPNETHSFQLSYVLANGQASPLSASVSGTTWGNDKNHDGLPDNWQAMYWGTNSANWPGPNVHLGGPNGPTVLQVFLWGANPLQPSTWLMASISHTSEGWFLSWNTQPGYVYQVQASPNLIGWTNLGVPRYAAGTSDSIYLGLSYQGFYQITRLVY
jgi:hypothetical protein